MIIANPLYATIEEISTLPSEYFHEPTAALAGGQNGLEIVQALLSRAGDFLTEEGLMVVEVGNAWVELESIFPKVPFLWITFKHGGHGVFIMSRAQWQQHQDVFISNVQLSALTAPLTDVSGCS